MIIDDENGDNVDEEDLDIACDKLHCVGRRVAFGIAGHDDRCGCGSSVLSFIMYSLFSSFT